MWERQGIEAISPPLFCYPERSEGSQRLENTRFFPVLGMTDQGKLRFGNGFQASLWLAKSGKTSQAKKPVCFMAALDRAAIRKGSSSR
jgi:hypothetical protein